MWRRIVSLRLLRAASGRTLCSPVALIAAAIVLSLVSFRTVLGLNLRTAVPFKSDKQTASTETIRWSEDQPGCTFTRGDDGKYRYGLWSGDVGVILAVDAREVQVMRHRIEPMLGLHLTFRYRGPANIAETPDPISLQFIKHFKIVETSLDPDDYTTKIQSDADAVEDDIRRSIAKRPEKKAELESRLQEYQKSVNELIEFLGHNSLRPAHLDPGTPEVSGWIFFNTNNKWLGRWKSQ